MKKVSIFYPKYNEKFKLSVILDIIDNNLNFHEVVRKHWKVHSKKEIDRYRTTVKRWYYNYLEDKMAIKTDESKLPFTLRPYKFRKLKDMRRDEIEEEMEHLRAENAFFKYMKTLPLEEQEELKKKLM